MPVVDLVLGLLVIILIFVIVSGIIVLWFTIHVITAMLEELNKQDKF